MMSLRAETCNLPRSAHNFTLSFVLLSLVYLCGAGDAHAQNRSYDCLLEPRFKIKLATPVAGVLKEVAVDRGDLIRKGDILARLDSGVEQASLALAQARAENDSTIKAREARLIFLTKKRERTLLLQQRGMRRTPVSTKRSPTTPSQVKNSARHERI